MPLKVTPAKPLLYGQGKHKYHHNHFWFFIWSNLARIIFTDTVVPGCFQNITFPSILSNPPCNRAGLREGTVCVTSIGYLIWFCAVENLRWIRYGWHGKSSKAASSCTFGEKTKHWYNLGLLSMFVYTLGPRLAEEIERKKENGWGIVCVLKRVCLKLKYSERHLGSLREVGRACRMMDEIKSLPLASGSAHHSYRILVPVTGQRPVKHDLNLRIPEGFYVSTTTTPTMGHFLVCCIQIWAHQGLLVKQKIGICTVLSAQRLFASCHSYYTGVGLQIPP